MHSESQTPILAGKSMHCESQALAFGWESQTPIFAGEINALFDKP